MQSSLLTSSNNSSIEDLRSKNQALERLVEDQRERIEVLERKAKPERRGLWGRVFGSMAVLVFFGVIAWPSGAGFNDGNDIYTSMNLGDYDANAMGYTAGVYDGIEFGFGLMTEEGSLGAREYFSKISACVTGWRASQMHDVFMNHLVELPEDRDDPAAVLLWRALLDVCKV